MEYVALMHKTDSPSAGEFLPDIIAAALDEVLKAANTNTAPVLFVLVGGSAGEGFAVNTSDIDLVTVHENAAERSTSQFALCGRRVEVAHYGLETFRKVITTPRQGCAGPTFFRQLDSRRRLLCSKPIYGAERFLLEMQSARYQEFVDDVAAFQRTAILRSFDDLAGTLNAPFQEDDLRIRTRTYLEYSVDVLLSSLGDFYFRDKWRMARIRRTLQDSPLKELCNPLCALISGRPSPDAGSLDEWLHSVFSHSALCQWLATFKPHAFKYLGTIDWAHLAASRPLRMPLLITEQGEGILLRTTRSTLLLPPVLALASSLSALGLPDFQACAFALTVTGREEDSTGALQQELREVNQRLGIS